MSKIKLEAPFRSFRGKVCKHTDIIFKEMYGTKFTSQICNPYTGGPTQAQTDQMTKLTTAVATVDALTPQEVQTYEKSFKKARRAGKYKTLRGYMIAQEMSKL